MLIDQFGTLSHLRIISLKKIVRISVLALISLLAVCSYTTLTAQTNAASLDNDKILSSVQKSATDQLNKTESIPVDNVIYPELYRVGPGDVLSFYKFDALSLEELLVVSPENTVIIPRIGIVQLQGKTLQQTRDTIVAIQKKRTPNLECAISLKKARSVFVTVRGNVLVPGVKTVPATYRVSTILKLSFTAPAQSGDVTIQSKSAVNFGASTSSDEVFMRSNTSFLSPYASRNITLLHSDGTSDVVDLVKAIAYPNQGFDPCVREGDEIIVPYDNPTKKYCSILGAVARPTVVAYKPGDKLSFLLKLGGRLLDSSQVSNVAEVSFAGKTKLNVTPTLDLVNPQEDRAISSGTIIMVEEETTNTNARADENSGVVRIIGEIEHQGAYPIEIGKTKLKNVLQDAGSFTAKAHLPLAYILRKPVNESVFNESKIERIRGLQYSNLTLEDTTRYMMDAATKRPMVSCDFVKAVKENSEVDNVLLQDGDVIVIPKNPGTVYVSGQVKSPGYVTYKDSQSLEWYVNQAGGFAEMAKAGRARIIKGRTKVWEEFDDKTSRIEAGDEIYVPRAPDVPPGTEIQIYSTILGALGVLASSIWTISQILSK